MWDSALDPRIEKEYIRGRLAELKQNLQLG